MKGQMQWVKVVPFLVALVVFAALTFGIVYVTSRPEVIQAKGEWATATASLFSAKQTYHQMLPEILTKGTVLAVSAMLAFAALAFVFSLSVNLVIYNLDRVAGHGWEYEKNVNGQKTTVKLFQTNPTPHKQLAGGQPNISVFPPNGSQLGGGKRGQVPLGVAQTQGRKLGPGESQAKNQRGKQQQQQGFTAAPPDLDFGMLPSGDRVKLDHTDPLSNQYDVI